jgi:uncharacterized protein (DUF2062 family)
MTRNRPSPIVNRKTRQRRARGGIARFLRYWYIRLVRLQGHPIEIARGLSVGVFSGFFPWLGLQIAIAIFLAIAVRGNKIAAAAATWISNPFTSIPIFIFNYKVGEWILGRGDHPVDRGFFGANGGLRDDWTSLGTEVLFTMFFGSLVTGTIAGVITYFIGVRLLYRWRGHRPRKPSR